MALTANKTAMDSVLAHQTTLCRYHEKQNLFSPTINRMHLSRNGMGHGLPAEGSTLFNEGIQCLHGKPFRFISKKPFLLCKSSRVNNTEEKGCDTTYDDVADITGIQTNIPKVLSMYAVHILKPGKATTFLPVRPSLELVDLLMKMQSFGMKGLVVTSPCSHVRDSMFRNLDITEIICFLRGMMTLEARARQDVAFLGTEFLKLDARAREDTGRIDRKVKEKAELLRCLATILKDKAQSRLKIAADEHWSDGALKADLHLADIRAKQCAMEDTLMALEFAKNIHEMMVNQMYKLNKNSLPANNVGDCITHQKNKDIIEFFPMDVSADRTAAIQEAYWSMASALSEADGVDYTDPEELELLITALMDLDAMDGKRSVSLLAECASSPDVSTRQALANALVKAPSTWVLGNAGMGALQRLAEDSSPAIAAAASRAIYELNKEWEIGEGYARRKTE